MAMADNLRWEHYSTADIEWHGNHGLLLYKKGTSVFHNVNPEPHRVHVHGDTASVIFSLVDEDPYNSPPHFNPAVGAYEACYDAHHPVNTGEFLYLTLRWVAKDAQR